ncbi:small ribosomal subunit protein uS15m [Halyomorpha halys]|uniref:small ribosomal subunit protein uS15m n=1 Tax=Halyomorpha halys TaxID=286706 RepID=UPI0006D4CAB5|nr:28S ribosomal protein S15, mitochondrial [Halyomorpha halys]
MGTLSPRIFLGALLKSKGKINDVGTYCFNVNFLSRFLHKHSVNYGLKSGLPIKWVRPEKIPCIRPEKSGDLEPLKKVDLKTLAPEFQDLEELKKADENVKKLFTLEFLPYKSTVSYLRKEYSDRVKRHEFDTKSPEVRVAKMTADIRDMQRFTEKYPHDKRTKVRLKETIDKRKKLLKKIRIWDYKCFEYIIEKLDLIYKPFPPREVYKRVERKRSMRMLTDTYCQNIVSEKLEKYKAELDSQKVSYLMDKIEILKWIMKEEAYCGVPPTVSEEDLKVVEAKLSKLVESMKKETTVINE